ncbi:hypothetical protein Ciccas_013201, partial [Cichlidogyrus casuarinus]
REINEKVSKEVISIFKYASIRTKQEKTVKFRLEDLKKAVKSLRSNPKKRMTAEFLKHSMKYFLRHIACITPKGSLTQP